MANRITYPIFKAFTSAGVQAASYKLWTYEAGTSTPLTTYQDSAATTPHTNPIILDALGEAEVFVSESVKLNLLDTEDAQVDNYPIDNIDPTTATASEVSFVAGGIVSSTNVQDAIDEVADYIGNITVPRNLIINGNFDLWHYSSAAQTSSGYTGDNRWNNLHSGSSKSHERGEFTIGQTEVPNNPKYYSKTTVTTASGAANFVKKEQRIEDVTFLSGKTVTLSFWAKADAAQDMAVSYAQNFGTTGSPSDTVKVHIEKITLTTSWVKYTETIAINSVSAKTLGSDGNDFTGFQFWYDAGSDYNDQTDTLSQLSGVFYLAQVQVEFGPDDSGFDTRPISEEQLLAARYYAIGTQADLYCGAVSTSVVKIGFIPFYISMREAPTVTFSGETSDGGSGTLVATSGSIRKRGFSSLITDSGSGFTDNNNYICGFLFTASAEL